MERFNFISISLGDECELCGQNTEETVESCQLCEESIQESLHENIKAHRACFLKDHQIHGQSQHTPTAAQSAAAGEETPGPPSHYVKMKDKIQAKLSSIPKFIVNPLYRYTHSSAATVDSAELMTSSCESARDKLPQTRLTVSQPSYSLDGTTVKYYTLSPFERRRQFAQTHISPMRRSRSEGRINECQDESSRGCLHCVQQSAGPAAVANTATDTATEAGDTVMTGSLQNTVQAESETQGRGTADGMGSPRSVGSDGVDSPVNPQRIPDFDQHSNTPPVTQDNAETPTQCLEAEEETKTNPQQDTKAKHNLPTAVSTETISKKDAVILRETSLTATEASDDVSQKQELLHAKNQQITNGDHNTDNDSTSVQTDRCHQQQQQQQQQPRTRNTLSRSPEMPVIMTHSKGVTAACTCASESCNKCSENSEKKNSKVTSNRLNTALRHSSSPSHSPSKSKPCTSPSEGAVLSLTQAMEYTKEKLSYRCTEDLSVLLEHFSRQIQAVSENLVQLLQDRHELQEQVEMRKIAIDQLLRLQTNSPGVSELDIHRSIALPAGGQTNR